MHTPTRLLKHILVIIALTAVTVSQSHAANLSSSVNRKQISLNETLTLTISYDQQVDANKLNLEGLEKDFEVFGLRPQSSSSVSIINGQRTQQASTVWTVTLVPKREGILNIPAFSIGSDQSRPISVRVSKDSGGNFSDDPLQVRVSSNYDVAYPNQQVIVDIELSAVSGVSNLNGPELVVNNAEVEAVGQQNFQRVENGVAKQVVLLKYAVFPKSAGELVIPIMTYTGVKGGQRSLFGTRGQQIIARNEQLKIKVRTAPDGSGNAAASPWFPAENVVVSAKWSGDTANLKVGDPITRTITITAVAQRSEAIPPLPEVPASPQFKSYQDQPQLDAKTSERGFISTRVESEAIVASANGEIVLPEIRLPWFDVGAKRWKEAILPAETLQISGAAAATPQFTQSAERQLQGVTPDQYSSNDDFWKWVSLGLAALVLLQTALLVSLNRSGGAKPKKLSRNQDETNSWKALQASLKSQDPSLVRERLVDWSRYYLTAHETVTLAKISEHFDDQELAQQLRHLDSSLFGSQDSFDSEALTAALKGIRKTHQKQLASTQQAEVDTGLAPLYKN